MARDGRFAGAGAAFYVLAAMSIAAAIAALAAVRFSTLAVFAAVQAALTVAVVLVVVSAWPRIEESKSTRTLVRRLEAVGSAAELTGAYRVPDVSLDFYLGRALARETDEGGLLRRVSSDPGRLWVVRADEVEALGARMPLTLVRVMTVSRRAIVRLSPGRPEGGRKDGP
jgi:hypothetical protein